MGGANELGPQEEKRGRHARYIARQHMAWRHWVGNSVGGGVRDPATTDATPAGEKKKKMLECNPEQFAYNHGWKDENFIYSFTGLFVSF